MIAAFNNVKRRRQAELLDQRTDLVLSSKSIPRALREKHRRANVFKMFRAQLVGPARRMQRIAKKNQTRNAIAFRGCDLRSDPPAHRLAADHQTILLELAMIQRGV